MQQNCQDAMALMRYFHSKPDLFITMTCNPRWEEITRELGEGQKASDRPDLVNRVFHLKLTALLKDIRENGVLGRCVACVHVIEFQKRGLPHAHILVILAQDDKPRTTEDIDNLICAELPDEREDPELFQIVTTCMLHSCNERCLTKNGDRLECSKKFPKAFNPFTKAKEDGFPEYRRRENGRTFVK